MMPRSLKKQSAGLLVGLLLVLAAIAATSLTSRAQAYTGEFCYDIYLSVHADCVSNQETNLRRAFGQGKDYTYVEVATNVGTKYATCSSDGCDVYTGYLSRDGTGDGLIENYGDPCNCGGGDYYGYLYS